MSCLIYFEDNKGIRVMHVGHFDEAVSYVPAGNQEAG
jgi:hypothetical protein